MTAVLLSAHVIAAIVLVGPIAAAASLFPRYARTAGSDAGAGAGRAVAGAMHRISRGYAVPALAVPVFGIGVGSALGVLGDAWVLASMALTVLAGVLLVALVVPGQRRVLDALDRTPAAPSTSGPAPVGPAATGLPRLAMATGAFNLVWAVVVVLMIVRPGSTTGV